MRRATRKDDEEILALIAARLSMSARDAGAPFGKSPEFVRTATNRVREEDISHAGEPAEVVAAAYKWSVS